MSFEMIRSFLGALPEGRTPGWKLLVNGKELMAEVVELVSKFGVFRWGFNGAYDTWGFEEPGGGGSVLVPYFRDEKGLLWVGVVKQPRPYQAAEPVFNLPRGFLDPGQSHFQAAVNEGTEELGLQESQRVFLLDGEPGNPNNTFFVTAGTTPEGELNGIRFWGVRFSLSEVEQDGEVFRFREGVVAATTKDAERIMGSLFIPWTKAARVGCMMSNTGVVRLVAMQALGNLK